MRYSPLRSASPRAHHPQEFDPGKLHDDSLIGSSKVAQFLGLPDSTFFLIRNLLSAHRGRDFGEFPVARQLRKSLVGTPSRSST
jgi:hypothetical protein